MKFSSTLVLIASIFALMSQPLVAKPAPWNKSLNPWGLDLRPERVKQACHQVNEIKLEQHVIQVVGGPSSETKAYYFKYELPGLSQQDARGSWKSKGGPSGKVNDFPIKLSEDLVLEIKDWSKRTFDIIKFTAIVRTPRWWIGACSKPFEISLPFRSKIYQADDKYFYALEETVIPKTLIDTT